MMRKNCPPGYIRVVAAVPKVRPGAVEANLKSSLSLILAADNEGADAVALPELGLTGYTCADLFYQSSLLRAAEDALLRLAEATVKLKTLVFVGLPVASNGRIFNCAAAVRNGEVLGVVPKTFLPSTREFYESRWFTSGRDATETEILIGGRKVPFGTDLLFADSSTGAVYGVELCEDMWAVVPPSCQLALAGANVIMNLSGSNELVGKKEYRLDLVRGQSARCIAGYVYAGAGVGESTTDLVFGGHAIIAENGTIVSEGPRFDRNARAVFADVDLDFISFERSQNRAFAQAAASAVKARRIEFAGNQHKAVNTPDLYRRIDPHPFVPADARARDERAAEIIAIQATGLATRLEAINCRNVVVGLSGGLDSALALLVCVAAFKQLSLPLAGIHVLTMPGFGTTSRTKGNAEKLASGLGLELKRIDIVNACRQHLGDIGRDESVHDITYENVQARERTQVLMDWANAHNAIVIGTGDLSELALGWCTYNADHMSMYGVNGGVPKTLVRWVVRYMAEKYAQEGLKEAASALEDILATPVSPELLPAAADGTIAQKTEDKVGPYELHDFFLYQFIRRGAGKKRIAMLADIAFKGVYAEKEISYWLEIFFKRFFQQQFKRSCLPDGPKVGSINLSPRGDWRMPSDADVEAFLRG